MHAEDPEMTTSNILKSLLMAILLASAHAQAADNSVRVAMEDGKTIAQFQIGDSNCTLVDGQIRCTWNTK
jgi:hypothetical protein